MQARGLVGDQARHEARRLAVDPGLCSEAAPLTPCTKSSNAGFLWLVRTLRAFRE
jgi:hypothetical protein